jgi:uncharacterized protein YdhG (YjbR/CyaY superfamily)
MKIKEEYKDQIITRRIGDKLITFDPNNADYEWYSKNGFEDVFETEKKVINFKNDVDTPIVKKKKGDKHDN